MVAGRQESGKAYCRYWAKAVCWDPSEKEEVHGRRCTENWDMSIRAVQRRAAHAPNLCNLGLPFKDKKTRQRLQRSNMSILSAHSKITILKTELKVRKN